MQRRDREMPKKTRRQSPEAEWRALPADARRRVFGLLRREAEQFSRWPRGDALRRDERSARLAIGLIRTEAAKGGTSRGRCHPSGTRRPAVVHREGRGAGEQWP